MLISPPFLPAKQNNESDTEWLDVAMAGGQPGNGAFPVSFSLGWHGGMHLTAPMNGNVSERVRIVSDGTVVFKRAPTAREDGANHPQNYRGGWTDNGCIVIRHDTAIGEGANAAMVTFFSVYMHLSELHPAIKNGSRVYRKDELGQAGQIYGSLQRQIHFEIVCDNDNLRKLVGRTNGDLSVAQNGRNDAVYGEMYFHLPVGTQVFREKPLPQFATAHSQPPKPAKNAPLPAPVAMAAIYSTTTALIVGLRYAAGDGAVARRGDACVSTYTLDGKSIAAAIREADAEYGIYTTATAISKAFPAYAQPAPSAVYELLRFGRVINTAHETLNPADVPHWRHVNYPGGTGWVNLNAAGITKFSDADFPHWRGWTLIDDSQDLDSRCDSPNIKKWLDISGNGKIDPIEAAVSLNDPVIADKLAKTICKFPSEWQVSTIDKRWRWLMEESEQNPVPLTEDDFDELKAHIAALCFAAPALDTALWHWNPLQFIKHFRMCGWLSDRELVRCIPAVYQTEKKDRGSGRIFAKVSKAVAQQRITQRDPVLLMQVCRKYGVDRPQRLAHFFAQVFRETGVLHWGQERGSGSEYEGKRSLGNTEHGDGVRFKGRGLIQTTGRNNYSDYGKYRGKTNSDSFLVEPNNFLLATDAFNCADTAGLYWVSRNTGGGAINVNRVADLGVAELDLRSVTSNVNGAEDGKWTGLIERRSHLLILTSVLLDGLLQLNSEVERRDV